MVRAMEVRCHHCEHRFVPVTAAAEVRCPRCGVMLLRHRASAAAGAPPHQPSRREMRRIFSPVPNTALYAAGLVLVAAILAPFWLGELGQASRGRRFVISEDAPDTRPAWALTNSLAAPAPSAAQEATVTPLDQFEGIQLGVSRESLERRFTFYRTNTRGMVPEIYEARDARGIERLTAYFYQNELREFVAVLPARVSTPDEWFRQLRVQYGEPADWSQGETTPEAAGVPGVEAGRYERFGLYRYFAWSDSEHRLEATIYFTSTDPVTCESVLVVRGRMREPAGALLPVATSEETSPTNSAPQTPHLFP